jgi:pimeloyl-ACP methyl ester carboxylesterase
MTTRPNPGRQVSVTLGSVTLPGLLAVPGQAHGLVLFAHGSGSSRLSVRNNRVAADLRSAGIATLLFDLLTEPESASRANVFDIPLLAERLAGATDWAVAEAPGLPVGYFGASTGAAAALVAAAARGDVGAIVSRGGRPDLAGDALPRVTAPTLLIVGSRDEQVLGLNRQALAQLTCAKRLTIVPGATHLFEEPGALEQISALARGWFAEHLFEANDLGR